MYLYRSALSLESKLIMEKQRSVIMCHIPGTNSLKSADPLWLSSLLNQNWRPFCLPLPFTEDCDFYFPVLSLLNLFYFSLISHFLTCFKVLCLDVFLLVVNVSQMQFFIFFWCHLCSCKAHLVALCLNCAILWWPQPGRVKSNPLTLYFSLIFYTG